MSEGGGGVGERWWWMLFVDVVIVLCALRMANALIKTSCTGTSYPWPLRPTHYLNSNPHSPILRTTFGGCVYVSFCLFVFVCILIPHPHPHVLVLVLAHQTRWSKADFIGLALDSRVSSFTSTYTNSSWMMAPILTI